VKRDTIRAADGTSISLYKRDSIYYVLISRGALRARVSTGERSRAGATQYAKRVAERIGQGFDAFRATAPPEKLLGYFVREWLERQAARLDSGTMESYKLAAEEMIIGLGNERPEAVTRQHARELVTQVHGSSDRARSAKTMKNRINVWHAIFADWLDANRDSLDGARANPFDRPSKLLEAAAPEPRRRIVEDDDRSQPNPFIYTDVAAILRELERPPRFTSEPWLELGVLLGLRAGLRLSEVLGRAASDFDFERGVVTVRRRLSRGTLGAVKTALSRRDVPMTPRLAVTASRRIAELRAELRQQGATEGRLMLFPPVDRQQGGGLRGREGVMDVRTFRRSYLALLARAGVEPGRKPFHRLRHTFVTYLLHRSVPTFWVSKWSGHASTVFTERVYAHWIPQPDQREMVARVEEPLF